MLCPPGRKPSSRSMGGRSCCGSVKVTSSPWIRSQSPVGRPKRGVPIFCCLRASASGSAVAPGQDQTFRHFEGRKTGVEMVEPAPDHGRFDAAGLGAEALMVPVAPFQGAVAKSRRMDSGLSSGLCSGSRCLQCSCIHSSGSVPLRSWGMKRNSLFSMARTSAWRMVSMVMGGTSSSRQPFSLSTAKSIKASSEA